LRIYETLLVIDPSLDVEKTDKTIDGLKSLIEKLGGKVTDIEKWGKRKLAYPINHHGTGFYTLILFSLRGEAVKELDRVIKISDEVIRYIIVRRFDKEKQ